MTGSVQLLHLRIIMKGNPSNYRRILLTIIFCKIMEHIVYYSVMEHLKDYNVLYNYQYGFNQGHFLETQFILLLLMTIIFIHNYVCNGRLIW